MDAEESLVGLIEVMNLARREICLRVIPALAPDQPLGWAAPSAAELGHWDRRDPLECRVLESRVSAQAARDAVAYYLNAMSRTIWRVILCEEA